MSLGSVCSSLYHGYHLVTVPLQGRFGTLLVLAHLFQEAKDGAIFRVCWVMEECHDMVGIRQSARAQAPADAPAVTSQPLKEPCLLFPTSVTAIFFLIVL